MEAIARQVPLSAVLRPDWDRQVLGSLGMTVATDESVWQQVWSPEERINFHATPMFQITACKPN